MLRGFGEGLKIAQDGIVKDVIPSQIATRLDAANLGDGIKDVPGMGLPGFALRSTASFRMLSRI